MPSPGTFIWTSPLGHEFLRDHTGSQPLEPTGHPPDH